MSKIQELMTKCNVMLPAGMNLWVKQDQPINSVTMVQASVTEASLEQLVNVLEVGVRTLAHQAAVSQYNIQGDDLLLFNLLEAIGEIDGPLLDELMKECKELGSIGDVRSAATCMYELRDKGQTLGEQRNQEELSRIQRDKPTTVERFETYTGQRDHTQEITALVERLAALVNEDGLVDIYDGYLEYPMWTEGPMTVSTFGIMVAGHPYKVTVTDDYKGGDNDDSLPEEPDPIRYTVEQRSVWSTPTGIRKIMCPVGRKPFEDWYKLEHSHALVIYDADNSCVYGKGTADWFVANTPEGQKLMEQRAMDLNIREGGLGGEPILTDCDG